MAIKLADVIERSHVSYPIVEAHDKTIVGFYNGAAASTQQPIQLHYNGSNVKISLTEDGAANTPISVTTSYKETGTLSNGHVAPNTSNSLLTSKGGIIHLLDSKLVNDANSAPSTPFTAPYLVNIATVGTTINTTRSAISNYSEIVQQFNRYDSITTLQAVDLDSSSGETFWLAGYDTERSTMRKLDISNLLGYIAATLQGAAVEAGIVTTGNLNESSSGSGIFGDYNNDGNVTTVDLLQFLGQFGQGPQDNAFDVVSKAMTGASENSTTVQLSQATGSAGSGSNEFVASDFDHFSFPGTNSLSTLLITNMTSTVSTGSNAAFIEIAGITITDDNSNFLDDKAILCTISATVEFAAADTFHPFLEVTYTTANNTVFSEMYHMQINNDSLSGFGAVSDGTSTNYPVGEPIAMEFTFSSFLAGSQANALFSSGTFNHGSATPVPAIDGGINLTTELGSQKIKKVKCAPVFNALNSATSITVHEMDVKFKIPTT